MEKLNHLQIMSVLDIIGNIEKEHSDISLKEAMFYIYNDLKKLADVSENSEPIKNKTENSEPIKDKIENSEPVIEEKENIKEEKTSNRLEKLLNSSFDEKVNAIKLKCKRMNSFYENNKNSKSIYPFVVKGLAYEEEEAIKLIQGGKKILYYSPSVDSSIEMDYLNLQLDYALLNLRSIDFAFDSKITKEELDYVVNRRTELLERNKNMLELTRHNNGNGNNEIRIMTDAMSKTAKLISRNLNISTYEALDRIKSFREFTMADKIKILKDLTINDKERYGTIEHALNSPNIDNVMRENIINDLFFGDDIVCKYGEIRKLPFKAYKIFHDSMYNYKLFVLEKKVNELIDIMF